MATFSENQVRHLYVVKSLGTSGEGAISVASNASDLYFKYVGPDGVEKTDIITKSNITQAKAVKYDKASRALNKSTLVLDPNVNGGVPLAGQDYILNIKIYEWGSVSFEDQYFKHAVVHATTGMTAEQFYIAMKASLVLNFQREFIPLLNFNLVGTQASKVMTTNAGITVTANNVGTAGNAITFAISSITAGANAITVTGNDISVALATGTKTIGDIKALIAGNAAASALITVAGTDATNAAVEAAVTLTGGTTTGIELVEIEQPWTLGVKESQPLNFLVMPSTIRLVAGSFDETTWGIATKGVSSTLVSNGKTVADMEYFYMGERGDQYRGVGFPNVIKTKYQADPTISYNFIEIDHFYQGEGTDVQKSQKHITLAIPAVGADNAAKIALTNSITQAITTAGVNIADLT